MTTLADNLNQLIRESLTLERAGTIHEGTRRARMNARAALFNATHGTAEGALEALDIKARALIAKGGNDALRGLSARRQLAILGVTQWEPRADTVDIGKAFNALRLALQDAKATAARRVKA